MSTQTHNMPTAGAKKGVTPVQAGTEPDSKARISEAVLNAAQAVNRYYTGLLMSRRSRSGGPR